MGKLGLREKKQPQIIVQDPNWFSNIIRILALLVSRLPILLLVPSLMTLAVYSIISIKINTAGHCGTCLYSQH